MPIQRPRVVIVGGGFAGLAAARSVGHRCHVTLVDAKPDFEFLPNLHELVSRVKTPRMLALSHARILERLGHDFVCEAVVSVEPGQKVVVTKSGRRLEADALILAPGSAPSHNSTPGATEHALALRTVSAGREIADRIQELADSASRGSKAQVTIVGGGYTGVEVLGEILRIRRNRDRLSLRLVESNRHVMKGHPAAVHQQVEAEAENQGTELFFEERVREVGARHVALESGVILPSDLTIWTTGGTAPAFLVESGLVAAGERWAPVRDTLEHAAFPGVFLAGDAAAPPRSQPKQASNALTMGRLAGKNAVRFLRGKALRRIKNDAVEARTILTFGDFSAFLVDGDNVLESTLLLAAREWLYETNLADLENLSSRRAARRLARRSARSFERILARTALNQVRFPRVWLDGVRLPLPGSRLFPFDLPARLAIAPLRLISALFS